MPEREVIIEEIDKLMVKLEEVKVLIEKEDTTDTEILVALAILGM